MQPLSQTKKMRQDFSVSIRREKKEEIFQSYRMKLKNNLIEQEQSRMLHLLNTSEMREEWLHRRARDLTGIPDALWRSVINELLWSLLCFKGKNNGNFRLWIEMQIIKNLCGVFHEDYLQLGLSAQVAKLLGSIICLEEQEEETKTSYVAQEVFNQEILRDLVNLCSDTTLPHNDISHYMTLIANLAANQAHQVIKYGGFTACMQWSIRMLKQKKINRAYLDQVYSFIEYLSEQMEKIPSSRNFPLQVLNLANEFIQIDQTPYLFRKLLSIVRNVLKCNKQQVYGALADLRPLVRRIFELSIHENESIRFLCWRILGSATSGKRDFMEIFQENNYLEAIRCAYENQPKDNDNFDKITSSILNCVNNLMCQGDRVREVILFSPVINIIIDSTHHERSTNLRKDAFFCLTTAADTSNYQLFNKIVYELPILETLVNGLETMMNKDKNTVYEILQTLLSLIRTDAGIYRNNDQGVRVILESKYNFSRLLDDVSNVHSKDQFIFGLVNSIFDLYSC